MNYLQNKVQKQQKLGTMIIFATQKATLTGSDMAIVELIHGQYGKYFEVLKYDEAKKRGLEVIRHIEPLPVGKLPANSKHRKPKAVDNSGQPAG